MGNSTNPKDTPPIVALAGVCKDYADLDGGLRRAQAAWAHLMGKRPSHSRRVLQSIDLELRRGESLGIIGSNGAGKSTLMKIIAGVTSPSQGRRHVNARVAALLELGAGFHPEYTGRENISLAMSVMGLDASEISSTTIEVIEFADIGYHIDQPVKTYSTGMAVRLGFALAISVRPALLITDEVLAVGDESFQKKCLKWMSRFRENGGALILCSHSMYHIQSLCDRAIWLDEGRLRASGDAFPVTQEYLAFHEAKSSPASGTAIDRSALAGLHPLMEQVWTEQESGIPAESFEISDAIVFHGTFCTPDDTPATLMVGIARIDETPVFGTFSTDAKFTPTKLSPRKFGFSFHIAARTLLPGRYLLRGHVLDEHGLRMFDTRTTTITVTGRTRDHGLVFVNHRWSEGKQYPDPPGQS